MAEWDVEVGPDGEMTVRHNHDGEWVGGYVESREDGSFARCPRDDRSQLLGEQLGDDPATVR
jgi:hypothetical protein